MSGRFVEVFYIEFLQRIQLVELWGIRSGPQEGRLVESLEPCSMSGPGVDSTLLTKCTLQMICNKDTMIPVADFFTMPFASVWHGLTLATRHCATMSVEADVSISESMWFYRPKQSQALESYLLLFPHFG